MELSPGWIANVASAPNGHASCFMRVLLAPHQSITMGTVLGRLDADPSTFVALDFLAADGRQKPAAVAAYPFLTVDSSEEVMVVRGVCTVRSLLWPPGATPGNIASGLQLLAQLGITPAA